MVDNKMVSLVRWWPRVKSLLESLNELTSRKILSLRVIGCACASAKRKEGLMHVMC